MNTKKLVLLMGLICHGVVANGATFLHMDSEPGDYIGQGVVRHFSTEDGDFTASINYDNGVSIYFDGIEWWYLDFAAPDGEFLVPGTYEEAARFPFQSPTQPGLSVHGDGRGCNTLTGRFVVLEAVYSSTNEVESFAADFEQHCEGGDEALFGSIRFNSTIGFVPQVSIKANGSFRSIEVAVGDPVRIAIQMESGDRDGEMAEWYVGVMGPYTDRWYKGTRWVKGDVRPRWIRGNFWPRLWDAMPFVDTEQIVWTRPFRKPGVYVFMFAVDDIIDRKLDSQYVDHVVVIVK